MSSDITQSTDVQGETIHALETEWVPHLVLIWAKHEAERVGEICRIRGTTLLGRRAPRVPHDPPQSEFFRQRPGALEPTGQLESPTLSRRQWQISKKSQTLYIESLGKQRLLHNGVPVASCTAELGDVVSVEGVISFLVEARPLHTLKSGVQLTVFGQADKLGIVGEHPSIWELRSILQGAGGSGRHVLVMGPSGVGKELVARGVHLASSRAAQSLLCRSAATIPASLVEAELFGHAANFPNTGMPARPGLIGSAHGTTLFLDEIGELDEAQQANLLRVLDAGEYQRLGEDKVRHSNFTLIAATNRSPATLKHDFLARFVERIDVPDLNARRSDIPLIIPHLLAHVIGTTRKPSQVLIEQLTRHQYTTNARELQRLLRLTVREGDSETIHSSSQVKQQLTMHSTKREPSESEIREVLHRSTSVHAAAHTLGLSSRYALYRLMKKWGITNAQDEGDDTR